MKKIYGAYETETNPWSPFFKPQAKMAGGCCLTPGSPRLLSVLEAEMRWMKLNAAFKLCFQFRLASLHDGGHGANQGRHRQKEVEPSAHRPRGTGKDIVESDAV